jgi:type III secretion protein U
MSEKTEQPSAKKLRDSRKQGEFARSRLLSSAAATAGGLFGFLAFADSNAARLKAWTTQLFTDPSGAPMAAIYEGLAILAIATAPALLGAFLGALAVSLATAGLHFNPDQVAPKLERVDPIAGFKRLFSLKQAAEVGKGLIVAAIMTWLIWTAVEDGAGTALRAVTVDGLSAFSALLSVLIPTLQRGLVLLLVLGFADYALARRRHVRELMMSKEDVKQEHKQSEGDPHQKAKRKAIGRQLAAGGAARGVQKATAVVVNPTHIAVALRYDEAECDAPYIVAKGQEADALKLKREAKDLGIPVVRDIPLARSLVQFDVGEEVPEELYQAAAALLKVALEKKDRLDEETP